MVAGEIMSLAKIKKRKNAEKSLKYYIKMLKNGEI